MNILKTMMAASLAAMAMLSASCQKEDGKVQEEPQLEVNANNISGEWELVEWNNAPLAEGT